MQTVAFFTFIYALLFVTAIIPAFKKKQKKALLFSIPVFIITYVINAMNGMGVEMIRPNLLIMRLVSTIFK